MTDSTILSREVAVVCWRTIGEVARASERRELEPVLHRARETGGTDSEDVARHLFFEESRKAVAERLLRIGVAFGLLEEQGRQYRLTESGERSIESGTVFVPERGAWRLWTSKDPLLPSTILRIDACEESESALDETHNREKERRFGKRCERPTLLFRLG